MGIYFVNQHQQNIYKSKHKIKDHNQAYARQDYLTEIIKEQQKAYIELSQSLAELNQRSLIQESNQNSHWNQVDHQLNDLRENVRQQKNFENQLQLILDNELSHKRDILNQVEKLNGAVREIASRLDKHEDTSLQLSQQMNEQLGLQKEVAEKLNEQETVQEEIIKRLDNQEALTEKISRQLNHIRSILFERTNYLASKIEEGYKVTSSYVYKLMTGSDQPLTFFLLNQHKEDQHVKDEVVPPAE